MFGYTGKILFVNLTTKAITNLNTSDYLAWGGGHGFGLKIFWDKCEDITVGAYDPRNIVSLMVGPLAGTNAASIGGRTEVQGISPIGYDTNNDKPLEFYSRSGFGGRFSGEMKRAGWDGIAITGKAAAPVWLNIINDTVKIEDATGIWGLDTYAAQQEIWRRVKGQRRFGQEWYKLGDGYGYTTQNPAVTTCGPVGERLGRVGALVHDGGNGAGNAGFGGVFGSKNLKAVSVWGSGSVEIADPKALMNVRMRHRKDHTADVDDPTKSTGTNAPNTGVTQWEHHRYACCQNCAHGCFGRTYSNSGYVDSRCWESYWYSDATSKEEEAKATDLVQRAGLNAGEPLHGKKTQRFLFQLYKRGILGNGAGFKINADPVPMDRYGSAEWAVAVVNAIATRKGIGDDLAEGAARFASKYGLTDLAFNEGLCTMPQWGSVQHWSLPDVSWAYGSLISDGRDKNTHTFGYPTQIPVERNIQLWTDHTWPWVGDPFTHDFSWGDLGNGIYTMGTAKRVAWDAHYGIFWMQSAGACCFVYFNASNTLRADFEGFSPYNEVDSWNAATGQNMTWEQSLEIGRKITNLERAINVIRGVGKSNEDFAGYFYKNRGKRSGDEASGSPLPYYDSAAKAWKSMAMTDMYLNRQGVAAWKNNFYNLEGWDPASGSPTRATLEDLGLKDAADKLQAAGKLGAPGARFKLP